MSERKISDIARKVSAEDYLHKVMEILEMAINDDTGKSLSKSFGR